MYDGGTKNAASNVFALIAVFMVMLTLGFFLVLMNWQFLYSYLVPSTAPGLLTTSLSDPVYWAVFVVIIARTFVLVCTVGRSAAPGNSVLRVLTPILCAIAIAAEVVALVFLFLHARGCNNAPTDDPSGTTSRYCNDFRYCCVYGTVATSCSANSTGTYCTLPNATIIADVDSVCPILLAPCSPTVLAGNLHWNWVFGVSVGFCFSFAIADLLVMFASIWMADGLAHDFMEELDRGTELDYVTGSVQENYDYYDDGYRGRQHAGTKHRTKAKPKKGLFNQIRG